MEQINYDRYIEGEKFKYPKFIDDPDEELK